MNNCIAVVRHTHKCRCYYAYGRERIRSPSSSSSATVLYLICYCRYPDRLWTPLLNVVCCCKFIFPLSAELMWAAWIGRAKRKSLWKYRMWDEWLWKGEEWTSACPSTCRYSNTYNLYKPSFGFHSNIRLELTNNWQAGNNNRANSMCQLLKVIANLCIWHMFNSSTMTVFAAAWCVCTRRNCVSLSRKFNWSAFFLCVRATCLIFLFANSIKVCVCLQTAAV